MDMTEERIYEALGVAPAGEGEKGQGPAAPDAAEPTQPAGEGGKAQEIADPAPEGGEPEDKPGERQKGNAPGQLTEEQRRENAAQRRRQEQEAAVRQAVQTAVEQERKRAKDEWDAFFKRASLKNTVTGAPISTLEEFEKWEADFAAARLERELKTGKLTQEGLDRAISETPAMKRVKEMLERADEERKARDDAAAKAKIDEEIKQIRELDPTINSVEDLLAMPTAKEFYEYVRKGNSFLDAFWLANREKLTMQTEEAAKQQAMNAARSKEHLKPAGAARGGGAVSVPPEVMEQYRLLNPTATEAEIQTHYNKNHKK